MCRPDPFRGGVQDGFRQVDVLPIESEMWRFYRLTSAPAVAPAQLTPANALSDEDRGRADVSTGDDLSLPCDGSRRSKRLTDDAPAIG